MIKRDNWTNEEVLKLLEQNRMLSKPSWWCEKEHEAYNEAIDTLSELFHDFTRPLEEMGAMGYNPEEDMVYHVGAIYPACPVKE